ncbi:Similar to Reduced viability upon starvation protein 167; acc. no. P39743 [Pyronema omphalodes CBS 100304]|uniref:Similar to Reduced viability upon starvation protein 167 acc. no. P39743 n=1 Tax=Pyronema omphalodes (strain CBS 100304) TaxID=1076935 RepID=U4LPM5_PYROM|nr:Similar to Reduced viability upon starvation protein 167; acc. no. P39743 [Pyronema omphalodes CBS 100304]
MRRDDFRSLRRKRKSYTMNLRDISMLLTMLDHQFEFSKGIAEIYKPISGRMSDPDSFKDEGNPEGIRACEEYQQIVTELKATLAPELEMIETRVIRPADELMEVIKVIRKTATKRHHKQLDYDRHRATLKKITDKKEKTLKDEKALYKAEADVELATQEFNYYNDLLKDELPKLFTLEREFIKPLFMSFYYMQLNIFYTLHEKMQGLNIGYFDLESDIEAAFEKKRGDVQERAEALTITKFRVHAPKMKLAAARAARPGSKDKEAEAEAEKNGNVNGFASRRPVSMDGRSADAPPPPYSASTKPVVNLDSKPGFGANGYSNGLAAPVSSIARSNSTGSNYSALASAAKKKPAPPPPPPKPRRLTVDTEYATALYDFEAQAEGDLSFHTGDRIEIVKRTQNANEWWTGRVGPTGQPGQFPGNYVKLG